jgi:2'-5' RNA ligase
VPKRFLDNRNQGGTTDEVHSDTVNDILKVSMGGSNGVHTLASQFALVSYIPDPLGNFLDRLRLDLVPGCSPHAHVTVLPPRPISAGEAQAADELMEIAENFSGFDIELGDVEIFPVSKVIYIGLKRGEKELREMYRALNRGAVAFREPFPYHPHVTLAQNFPMEALDQLSANAVREWQESHFSRSFPVHSLDFVKNIAGTCWTDLASIQLRGVTVG